MQPKTIVRVEAEEPAKRLAVLIDADNAQAAVIEALLEEVARFGEATVRRIYGDFTSPSSSSWKKVLNRHSIKPVQQFAYTTGKNATDSTMIIDAMDLLYTRRFDGYCLVTSDSDFTGLAVRLREEGLVVYGFGEQKTPEAFRNACHKFVFTEVLRKPIEPGSDTNKTDPEAPPQQQSGTSLAPVGEIHLPAFPKEFLMEALENPATTMVGPTLARSAATSRRSSPTSTPGFTGSRNIRPHSRTLRPLHYRRTQCPRKRSQAALHQSQTIGANQGHKTSAAALATTKVPLYFFTHETRAENRQAGEWRPQKDQHPSWANRDDREQDARHG
jgi:hypothetical protein